MLPKAIIIKMDKKVLILWLFLKAGGHIMQMFYGGTSPLSHFCNEGLLTIPSYISKAATAISSSFFVLHKLLRKWFSVLCSLCKPSALQ